MFHLNSITGAQITGSNSVNLISDPLFQHGNIYWDFSNAPNVSLSSNLEPNGTSGLSYTGTGAASGFQEVLSAYISVVSGSNYVLTGFIDATNVTGTNYPAWLIKSTDRVTTYATASQVSGVSGITVSSTFQFPPGVNTVLVEFNTENCVVANTKTLVATIPQLEFGTAQSIFKTSYTQQPTSGTFPSLFGSQTYSSLNPPVASPPSSPYTPSTAPTGSIILGPGATGTDTWTATAYSGDNGLQLQVNTGYIVLLNYQLGIEYTITGAEVFSFYVQVTDNTPQEFAIRLIDSGSNLSNTIYWGDGTIIPFTGKINGGATFPISKNTWLQFVFTAAQVGFTPGTIITGLIWGLANNTGTSTLIFSDFTSSNISAIPNYFVQTGGLGIDAVTVPSESILTIPIMSGGTSAQLQWVSGTAYFPGQLLIDSNNNGEICTSAITIDLTGQRSPTTCFSHFGWLTGGTATPTGTTNGMDAKIGSTAAASATIVALAPTLGGTFPDIVAIHQSAPSTTVSSITLSTGSPTVGNYMLAFVVAAGSASVTPPAGWTLITNSGTVLDSYIFYRIATGSEPPSYTFTLSATVNCSAALLEVFGVGAIDAHGFNTGSGVGTINVPSITPVANNCTCLMSHSFNINGALTVLPTALSLTPGPPSWNPTAANFTQDNAIIWENIGPNYPYDQWIDVALPITLDVNNITDFVDLFVTDTQYATSNMAIGDSVEVQFVNASNVIIAQGIASVSSYSSGGSPTAAQSSSQGSGILLHKKSSGILVGVETIKAQIRTTNGSGNGEFSFALTVADVEAQDNKK